MYNCAYLTGLPGVGCGVKLQHCALLPAVGSSWGRGVPGVVQDYKLASRAKEGQPVEERQGWLHLQKIRVWTGLWTKACDTELATATL